MAQVSRHGEDIVCKCVSRVLGSDLVRAYGLKPCRVRGIASSELPFVPLARRLDYLFRLEDESLLHLEFQASRTRLERFLVYDALLCERDRRKVQTVIIYTGGITRAKNRLDYGCLAYKVTNVFMGGFNGEAARLRATRALKKGRSLSGRQQLDLIFSPLMGQKLATKDAVVAALKVTVGIADEEERAFCQASIVGLGDKFLNEEARKKIREVLGMTRFVEMLMEEGMEKGMEKGLEKGMEKGREEGREEGRIESILLLLQSRFNCVPSTLQETIRLEQREEKLRVLLIAATQVGSLGEFESLITKRN